MVCCLSSGHVLCVFDSLCQSVQQRRSAAIGSEGSGDGQLKNPNGLAINKFNNLIVCVSGNHRQQVFTLDGTFLNTVKEVINEIS